MNITDKVQPYSLFIDGKWLKTKQQLAVYNKFSNEVMAEVSIADHQTVDHAITAAVNAFQSTELTPYERYEILKKTSELLIQNKEELAQILTGEVGKTIREARTEVERAAQTFEISAEEAKRIEGEYIPIESSPGSENRLAFSMRVPVGVVCAITPFNVPLNLIAHKVAPALAAGNTVVLKPASYTPIVSIKLAELMEKAGLPKGYLNIVVGSGSEIGKQLMADERINLFTFTGSPMIGQKLKQETGIKKVLLELGSNSAVIVHEDADLDLAVKMCVGKSFATAGQVCISVQRLYVHENVYDAFMERFIEETNKLQIGNPFEESTDVGPMISEKEAIRVESWVQEAVEAGAQVVTGGKRDGVFYEPTILTNVHDDMKVSCEEVFGPVVGVRKYSDLDGCIRSINQSKYGLQAGIFTRNLNTAFHAARKIHVGGVIVNDASQYRADLMPYGGVKDSGSGKEGPKYAIREMTEEKVVVLNLNS
ncbi:aldehyde dehydrogenase family protein [Lederbergia graminis]|uniref:Aldehyde dehydrogenase family protein n=1 Tax=Lederbergia graminis TaxID=735518 RepID=A0ABW0LFQ8_9BACI